MKAFRVEQRYTVATDDIAEVTKRWAELNNFAAELGFDQADGGVAEVPLEEIVPGSPLAARLEAAK